MRAQEPISVVFEQKRGGDMSQCETKDQPQEEKQSQNKDEKVLFANEPPQKFFTCGDVFVGLTEDFVESHKTASAVAVVATIVVIAVVAVKFFANTREE